MKKKLFASILTLTAGLALVLPLSIDFAMQKQQVEVEKDPVSFEEDRVVNYDNPDLIRKAEEAPTVKSPSIVKLHYHNDDMACLNRRFYTWVTGVDGIERKPDADTWTTTDMTITLYLEKGGTTEYDYKDMPSLFFIIKVAGTWAGQSEDIELKYESFPPDDSGLLEVWTIPGEGSSVEIYKTEAETKFPKIKTAKFDDWKTIHCEADEKPTYYKLYAFDKNYLMGSEDEQVSNKQFHLFKEGKPTSSSFDIKFNYTAKINVQYVIESEYASNPGRVQKIVVSCENLFQTDRFEKYYTYSGNDLGMTYSDKEVTFKVWSPISAMVNINIYNVGMPKSLGGSDACRSYNMNYTAGGVWQITIQSSEMTLKNKFYTYSLTHSAGTVETIDPYAKACGINGIRAFIYDKNATEANPEGWDTVPAKWDGNGEYDIKSPQDLSIYECHIRDLTMDESWISHKGNARGTYNAFCESGTTVTDNVHTASTGFDHITELGVKAVQLVPVFDNDNDERPDKMKFNWGYNPLNYNCVEGGYSSNPEDPLARIVEYKNLVKSFSENGNHTRIIMDVVYNHVSSASSSCFTKVMPKYYFRYNEKWEYLDGSGCNNEVKSDATMMRKYIVDSLCWWATEYKIKGFRFDLMGLLDTLTLKLAKEALYKIDPDIYIYGEGWTSGGYHGPDYVDETGFHVCGAETAAVYQNLYSSSTSLGYVGAFNDAGRNALKGSNDDGYNNNPYPQWGLISQGSGDVGEKTSIVADMMKGYHTGKGGNPCQTVNYASCHDNYTLWDQINYCNATKGYNDNHSPVVTGRPDALEMARASIAAHGVIMASNGVGFIQGGEELYRTKQYSDSELKLLMDAGTVRPYPDYVHYSSDPDVEIATADVRTFDNKVISHNSYKSSDNVNSFKWTRKLSVDGKSTYELNKVWSDMIKERNNMSKYDMDNIESHLSAWGIGAGSTTIGYWVANASGVGGYYFVFGGRENSSLGIGLNNTSVIFESRSDYSYLNGSLSMKPFTFICFKVSK